MNNPDIKFNVSPIAVGRYIAADGSRKTLAYSALELERARLAVTRVLDAFHFRTGGNVLFTAMWDEAAQLLGAERAIMSYGMVVVSADASVFDAGRVANIARRFKLIAAMGITQSTLEGLTRLDQNPAKVFEGMVVWARPGAYETLKALPGLQVYRCLEVGPAFAIECPAGCGAHLDRFEWKVEEEDGEVILSSQLERSEPFYKLRTGLKGKVIHGVCDCGNPDPRVLPT
jgi:hypothetical protein